MGIVKSFLGGLLMTLVLAVLVPVFCNEFILPELNQYLGDRTFLMLSSEMLMDIIMYIVIIGFMGILGGTMVFKTCGVFGVLGLVAAYYVLGDVTDAVVPVLMLLLSLVILKTIEIKRRKRVETVRK